MFKFTNSVLCGSVLLLHLSMQSVSAGESITTGVYNTQRFTRSIGLFKSHFFKDDSKLICKSYEEFDPIEKVHDISEVINVNRTHVIKSASLNSSDSKFDELEGDRDTFFTWESILMHIVVFFACFLLY